VSSEKLVELKPETSLKDRQFPLSKGNPEKNQGTGV